MARVTVEDCVERIPNRFELVMLAAQRAREISSGAPLTVAKDEDKNPVVALREIADETVGLGDLKEGLVRGLQRNHEIDEPEEDIVDFPSPVPPGPRPDDLSEEEKLAQSYVQEEMEEYSAEMEVDGEEDSFAEDGNDSDDS